MKPISPNSSEPKVNAISCSECADQCRELERTRQLFTTIRLAHGAGSATRSLERKISELEVYLFRHECREA